MRYAFFTAHALMRSIERRPDVVLGVFVAFVVSMLMLPLPPAALDALIALNIAFGVILLMVCLFAKNALALSSFPTLLLLTTLFRLGLNVSTTRGILSSADAGDVVRAFGEFVIRGDIVVGMVIFLVITLVQFLVIAKGAERVAEVGARFTLDAMPGKQMSIDADLRQGCLTDEQARDRRRRLERESQLFGNMDGAMKFVKGDAIAALIITALNLIAGFAIGVARLDMPLVDAVEVYSVLTVGDGLVSQMSSLMVTIAAGILVTRVVAEDEDSDLGHTLKRELASNPRSLDLAAGMMFVLAVVPGLPAYPFVGIGGALLLARVVRAKRAALPPIDEPAALERRLQQKVEDAKAQSSLADKLTPCVVPIGIDLGVGLSRALGFTEAEPERARTELVDAHLPQLRDALYLDMGVQFPGARVRPFCGDLDEDELLIELKGVPARSVFLPSDKLLAIAPPAKLRRVGIEATETDDPLGTGRASLIDRCDRETAAACGIGVWSLSEAVVLHLGGTLRRRAKEFVGLQEVSDLLSRLERVYPALVKEVVPKVVSPSQLADVLRRLVDEGVPIRDLKTILEALEEHGTYEREGVALTEHVRAALAAQLAYTYAGMGDGSKRCYSIR